MNQTLAEAVRAQAAAVLHDDASRVDEYVNGLSNVELVDLISDAIEAEQRELRRGKEVQHGHGL